MASEHPDLIAPDETAFRLELTPAQLKVTHSALHRVIREVLAKLPDEASIRSIDLSAEIRRATST